MSFLTNRAALTIMATAALSLGVGYYAGHRTRSTACRFDLSSSTKAGTCDNVDGQTCTIVLRYELPKGHCLAGASIPASPGVCN